MEAGAQRLDLQRPQERGQRALRAVATGLTSTRWSEGNLPFGSRASYAIAAVNRAGIAGPQSAPISFEPIDDTTPAPWKGLDIGDAGGEAEGGEAEGGEAEGGEAEGDDGFLNGTFTIHGSGEDVWGSQDAFRFVFQPLNGDGQIVTRAATQENNADWAKSGLMIRESLQPGARNAFVFRSPGHGIVMQWRGRTGGGTEGQSADGDTSASPWLKLARRCAVFTAWVSKDGHNWTQFGTTTVAMAKPVLIGLAVNAHTRGGLNRTTFDNTTVATGAAP